MIVTIHQPEHLPYYGFLHKIASADIFVVLDDVDYQKQNFQNRNRISTPHGVKWITIPLNSTFKKINEKETVGNWKNSYRNKIVNAYCKHPFFIQGMEIVDNMLLQDSNLLVDYNMSYITQVVKLLDIPTPIVRSSSLKITSKQSQRLLDICTSLGASHYLAGKASSNYLDESLFVEKVEILHHNFVHPTVVTPYLSSLDYIMSIGVAGLQQLLKQNSNTTT